MRIPVESEPAGHKSYFGSSGSFGTPPGDFERVLE